MKRLVIVFLLLFLPFFITQPTQAKENRHDIDVWLYQDHGSNKCYYPDCIQSGPTQNGVSLSTIIRIKMTAKGDPQSHVDQIKKSNPSSWQSLVYNKGDPTSGFIKLSLNNIQLSQQDLDANGETTYFIPTINNGRNSVKITFKDKKSNVNFYTMADFYIFATNSCTNTQIGLCGGAHTVNANPFRVCDQVQINAKNDCENCMGRKGIWTAVGCIPTDPMQMIKVLLRIGLLIGGGVALLIILAGSFILSTSTGDPKKTSEAKEMISSALIGLVFIIFSVSILQLIGVQILRIPGFGQ